MFVAQSSRYNQGINIKNLLNYPQSAVSLPLITADGSRRKTVKSKLFDAAINDLDVLELNELPSDETFNTYFLDLAAAISSSVGKVEMIGDLACKLLSSIPNRYKIIFHFKKILIQTSFTIWCPVVQLRRRRNTADGKFRVTTNG